MADQLQLWKRFCDYLFLDRDLGLSLDISRMRFDDAFLNRIQPAMQAAFRSMNELERGAIANRDENRMVGHYWLRAPELAPSPDIGQEIRGTLTEILDFRHGVHDGLVRGEGGPFENILHIGIGGSALGPQFVAQALGTSDDPMVPYFFDNTDPDGFDLTLSRLRGALDRTLVIVVSKSGGTPETRNGMLEAQQAYRAVGLDFSKHAVAITQVGSQLDRKAAEEGWLKRFPMWDWVGGRTSVMSAVGLLPAALQGIDVEQMLAGAAAMDIVTRVPDTTKNPAALLALMWYYAGNGKGEKDMVILPYKDRLQLFSKYLQQLVMESLGKTLDRHGKVVHQGIAVYGNKGTTDQHAYVQQLRDGVANFFVTFIEVLKARDGVSMEVEPSITSGDYLEGLLQGTRQALYENGRDSITISIEEVTPASVGKLIALYERAVGFYGELVDVNAYHQPGVEAGKKAARGVLDLELLLLEEIGKVGHPRTAKEIADAIGKPAQVEVAYRLLEYLAANPGRGVLRVGDGRPELAKFRAES
ncbi:MAG: glucose-6-phosphate isomerase [Planctomycetota bacterium]